MGRIIEEEKAEDKNSQPEFLAEPRKR